MDVRNSRPGIVSVSVRWRCLVRDGVGCALSHTASAVAGDGGRSHLFAIVMSVLELGWGTGASQEAGRVVWDGVTGFGFLGSRGEDA